MASIDAARALLARDGEELCARLLRVVAAARDRLREVPGLDVLDGPAVEPAKLVVLLAGTGAHGIAVEADLIAAGMPVEMADRDTIIPIVTLADDEAAVTRFTAALASIVEAHRGAAAAAGSGRIVDGHSGDGHAAAGGILLPQRNPLRPRGRRPGERRIGGAVSAGRPGARPGRGDHRRRHWTRCARPGPTAAGSPTPPIPPWPPSRSSPGPNQPATGNNLYWPIVREAAAA